MGVEEEEKGNDGNNNFMKKHYTEINYITWRRDFCG